MQLFRMASAASLIFLLLGCSAAQAGDIYRWVDDKGVTQIGDTVPQAYKARAIVIGNTQTPVDADQQKDAETRAARDAALLKQMQATAPAASSKAASTAPPQPKPTTGGTDCASLYAAYRASQACYAPYVTQNGLRGGSNCTSVPDPSPQCGSPSAYPQ